MIAPSDPGLASPFRLVAAFAADVARDLACAPKRLQPKYLYDELGSSLFAAICRLPWYPVTRAEKALLVANRGRVAQEAGERVRIVELGCGTGEKLRLLADAFVAHGNRAEVHLVDVSRLALNDTARAVASTRFPVRCHKLTYEEGVTRACAGRAGGETILVLFLGSNIGNFDPPEAVGLLQRIRGPLVAGDRLLLGVDLVKPEPALRLAYDDPLGVTAAFNKNLLARMNRELLAEFNLDWFRHVVRWDSGQGRVEMHLESTRRHAVHIPAAQLRASFEAGETIWTESSYKWEPDQIGAMAALTGFEMRERWIDDDARFALALLTAV